MKKMTEGIFFQMGDPVPLKNDAKSFSDDMQRFWYRPICNELEIDRLLNVKNAADFLLRERADYIVDHMRLFRVVRNKALKDSNWSLAKFFHEEEFQQVLNAFSQENREKCRNITAGCTFSTDPNGCARATEYGPIISIDESLNYFFMFMNLGLYVFEDEDDVPVSVQFNAIRIALRIMLKTETLDFDLDPRGIIPPKIQKKINQPIVWEKRFIIGHEYAHFLLKHVSTDKVVKKEMVKNFFGGNDGKKDVFYTTSQQEEFAADSASISFQKTISESYNRNIFESALVFFGSLAIYEAVVDSISPQIGVSDHPSALDRFDAIYNKYVEDKEYWKCFRNRVQNFQKIFVEDVSLHCDEYETYGSCYLAEPNTKWRGRELIDRVDYY